MLAAEQHCRRCGGGELLFPTVVCLHQVDMALQHGRAISLKAAVDRGDDLPVAEHDPAAEPILVEDNRAWWKGIERAVKAMGHPTEINAPRHRGAEDEVPPESWRVPYAASCWRAAVASNETGVIIAAEL